MFKNIKLTSIIMHLGITLLGAYFVRDMYQVPYIVGWLIIVNAITLLSFGKDKLSAKMHWSRTPESTFLTMGVFGAFPSILIGRKLFNHKTTKREFIIPMWILFTLQIIATIAYIEHVSVKGEKYLAPFIFGEETITEKR